MHEKDIIRELAKRYAAVAADPRNDERRRLWSDHLSLRPTSRTPVLASTGPWNVWMQDELDRNLRCEDPVLRGLEAQLYWRLLAAEFDDDAIFEPWLTFGAVAAEPWELLWGIPFVSEHIGTRGSAERHLHVLPDLEDLSQIKPITHTFDEEATQRQAAIWHDALGGILPFEITRTLPRCTGGDLSTAIVKMRGIEGAMLDMVEQPEALHRLLAYLRDGFLAVHAQMVKEGHWTLATHYNQVMPYAHELPPPAAHGGPVPTSQLWYHAHAQDFTGISPAMHEEFILQYQRPLIEQFGLSGYGCCEDLSRKIDILRKIPNLRYIAVSPMCGFDGLARCVEQIGTDTVVAWRPSPADCVCNSWNPERVERILRTGLEITRGTHRHINLKDIHTVQGDPSRIRKFCTLARRLAEEY